MLDFPPYTLTACERELGLLREDYSPKPVMVEMKKFQEFRAMLPFRKLPRRRPNCVIVVPEKVRGWEAGFGNYLFARQAGLDPVFAGAENQELPESKLYIVSSVDEDSGYSYPAQRKFFGKAKDGATVLVIVSGNSRYTHFKEQTGLVVDYGCRAEITREFTYGGERLSVHDSFTAKHLPAGCEVLAAPDGSTIVIGINFEPTPQTCPVTLRGKLGRVWRGNVKADSVTLAPNEAAVFEVLK